MQLQPYLFFNGRCEEALSFYRQALNAEVIMMMRFKEAPAQDNNNCDQETQADWGEKIMHASIKCGESVWMASDGMPGQPASFSGFSLSISAQSPEQAQKWFKALADGGQVTMPLQKTFWAESFGMLKDRFGVQWMVSVMH